MRNLQDGYGWRAPSWRGLQTDSALIGKVKSRATAEAALPTRAWPESGDEAISTWLAVSRESAEACRARVRRQRQRV
jgi:hypothetical protein